MRVEILLQMILIFMVIVMIMEKSSFRLIVYFAMFSLITAGLYFAYRAPDVALAEVAIGSAILPLIFIISISKKRVFVVVSLVEDHFLHQRDGILGGWGYDILEEFTTFYELKLEVLFEEKAELEGVFKQKNADLIVDRDEHTGTYILRGKDSNIMLNRLQKMIQPLDNIFIVRLREEEFDV